MSRVRCRNPLSKSKMRISLYLFSGCGKGRWRPFGRRHCRRASASPGLACDGPPLAPASGLSRRTPPRPLLAQQMLHAGRAKRCDQPVTGPGTSHLRVAWWHQSKLASRGDWQQCRRSARSSAKPLVLAAAAAPGSCAFRVEPSTCWRPSHVLPRHCPWSSAAPKLLTSTAAARRVSGNSPSQ